MTIGEIIPVEEYDYMIFPHDNKFKVKWGVDGSTVFETTDQTDAYDAFEYCRDNMLAVGAKTVIKPFVTGSKCYQLSEKLVLDATIHKYQLWTGSAGPWNTGIELRATTNTPIFELTGGLGSNIIQDMKLSHNQSGYSSSLIRCVDANIENIFRGLRFEDYGKYKGNCISFEVPTDGKQIYTQIVDTIISRGFERMFYFNVPNVDDETVNFIASIIFDKIFVWNAKGVCKGEGNPLANLIGCTFNNIHYQYSALNPIATDGSEAIYDFADDIKGYMMRLIGCMTWDIPAGSNVINCGDNMRISATNSNGMNRIGGSKPENVRYWDYDARNDGVYTTSTNVATRDFTIIHGLGITPRKIFATVMNTDTHTILPHTIPQDQINTSSFKVRLSRPPPLPRTIGANNLVIAWEVYY